MRHDSNDPEVMSAGVCKPTRTNSTHCPLFFDSMMCRLPTRSNTLHPVECSAVPLHADSTHKMTHKCLPNATWERGWNHSREPDNPHVTDTTKEVSSACQYGVGQVLLEDNSIEVFMYFFASVCSTIAW